MIYNLCNNRGTHPHSAIHEDLLLVVPSTTNSSNQLHLTLVRATKFSARACIKLLFSTLSCISIFVPNVFNHYTSKNRHQSFTFPPLITFLPLIVNRIPAGIGWFVLPAFLYVIAYLSVFFPLYPPALIARFFPTLLNLFYIYTWPLPPV